MTTVFSFSSSGAFAGDVVFAGYGIRAEELGYDDYADLDVTGKVVMVFRYEPQEDDPDSVFDGRRPSRFSELRYKALLAREAGAAALVLVVPARAEDDPDVRVIILRGEGPTFSGGHDLGSPDALATRAERENEPMGNRYPRTRGMDVDPHLRWRDIPKPTIAVVQGACIYAAWMLASAMDVIFAAEDAQFLPTNFAYFAVPWDIGARRAKYLMFDNRFLTAREAMDWGFVQEVHPSEELEAAAMASAPSRRSATSTR